MHRLFTESVRNNLSKPNHLDEKRVCDVPSTFFYKEAEMMKYCKRHHNLFHLHSFPPSSSSFFSFFEFEHSSHVPTYLFSIVLVSMYVYMKNHSKRAKNTQLHTHTHTHTHPTHRAHHESP